MINNFTQTKISFLSTIDRNLKINKSRKYHYSHFNSLSLLVITSYIHQIKDDDILLIFPFITTTKRASDPYLRLSEPFLVTNQSNPILILEFLSDQ
jgi:hypothetical protein